MAPSSRFHWLLLVALVHLHCIVAGVSSLSSKSWVIKEQRLDSAVRGGVDGDDWVLTGRANATELVTLTLAVKQSPAGVAALERTLLERSDPNNVEKFGQWLSRDEVDSLVAPSVESVTIVSDWLHEHVQDIDMTSNGDFMSVTLTIAEAERLLGGGENGAGAAYYHFRSKRSSASVVRLVSDKYYLPSHISPHIDFIGPTIRFPTVSIRRRSSGGMGMDMDGVTPSFLRDLYNASSARGAKDTKNIQACCAFLDQYYAADDLSQFLKRFSPNAKVTTPKVVGPDNQQQPGIEASLDIEYIMGVGVDIPTVFWSTNGQQPHNPENEPFLVWLQAMASESDESVPKTFSVSYGDNEPGVNEAYAIRVNTEFQKAGARGISIMFSSGDGGVAGGQMSACKDGIFIPTFPASSPWVTAVGGTTGPSVDKLTAASFSSGGFSNYFGRPEYQKSAVAGYFAAKPEGLPSSWHFNATGIGIPDVAAQGENFKIVNGMNTESVDGTSCSAPTFTAVVSLLNEARLQAGKSTLGYLNQMIYKQWGPSGAFNDVTDGSNPGCNTNGFPATKGWDPVTGWGSPKYNALLDLVMALP